MADGNLYCKAPIRMWSNLMIFYFLSREISFNFFDMITIHLHQIQFFAYHGLYPQEKTEGNNFELDAAIDVETGNVATIADTVDYSTIYQLIAHRMQTPTELLETLLQDLAAAIGSIDARIRCVKLSIKKMKPPIQGFNGQTGVSLIQYF
jgi:7,8-dihydroneopterin aldolase/epimerase/oxygenase